MSAPEEKKVEAFLHSSRRKESEVDSVNSFIDDLSKTGTIDTSETSIVSTESPSLWASFLALLGLRDFNKRFSFVLTLFVFACGIGLVIWNTILNHNLAQVEAMQVELEIRNRDLRRKLDSQNDSSKNLSQQIEEANRRSEQIEQEFAAIRESNTGTTPRNIVTLALIPQPFGRDTGQLKVARISPDTKWLQLTIDTGGDGSEIYSAVIKTFEDRLVWGKDVLRPAPHNPSRVKLMVPASLLANGDYSLTLKGQRENNMVDYYFRVKK